MMEKNNMQFDVRNAKIYKDAYRPSSSVKLFAKYLWSILLQGQSPIYNDRGYKKMRKIKD